MSAHLRLEDDGSLYWSRAFLARVAPQHADTRRRHADAEDALVWLLRAAPDTFLALATLAA